VARLGKYLKFALPDKAAQLVMIQLGCPGVRRKSKRRPTNHPPPATREEAPWEDAVRRDFAGVERLEYVGDCDHVAEYVGLAEPEPRRHEIRQLFRYRYVRPADSCDTAGMPAVEAEDEPVRDKDEDPERADRRPSLIEYWVRARLIANQVEDPGSARREELAEQVLDRVFEELRGESPTRRFDETAATYRPEAGRQFKNYLGQVVEWQVREVVRQPAGEVAPQSHQGLVNDPVKPDPDAPVVIGLSDLFPPSSVPFAGQAPESIEEAEEGIPELGRRLKELASCMAARLKERELSLFYLYFKAYWQPDLIPTWVAAMVQGGRNRLEAGHADAMAELNLAFEQYLEASGSLADAERCLESRERAVRGAGASPADLAGLQIIARSTAMGELRDEIQALNPHREVRWHHEVEYMIAWKQREREQHRYEDACEPLQAYATLRKPWVRTQKELAGLFITHPSTGAIGRELAAMKQASRQCAGNPDTAP
jgi:hypothetical protein